MQAYAMCEAIRKVGFTAEQICYVRKSSFYVHKVKTVLKKSRKVRLNYYWRYINRFLLKSGIRADYSKAVINKFDSFMEFVPHSGIYTFENVRECVSLYDVFVSGSDQVWNPDNCTDEWFFNFLPNEKKRIAYSASIGKKDIENSEKARLKPLIEKYSSIGVRENEGKELLSSFVSKKVTVVLDPVMLLSEEEWNKFDKWDFLKNEEYIFAYLVSYEKNIKDRIIDFSKRLKLKVVLVIDPRNVLNQNPKGTWIPFGTGVGPEEFIALMLNAKYVFTNSFHGTALAINFHKNFFTYYSRPVTDKENLNSRIDTVLDIFKCKSRLIFEDSKLSDEELKKSVDYSMINRIIESERVRCLDFLKNSIEEK
ncbi:Polysaccharide pyruvyl transferase [Oribacterium sp. KHPX15]|nr:Polysaccharide pyruvyl transferase [Oribacterium sp. KHPX15]